MSGLLSQLGNGRLTLRIIIMGSYIARQPNGLYCRFSTVVDTVTHWNMTETDYINFYKERNGTFSEEEARNILKNRLQPFERIKNEFIPGNDSVEEFEEMLRSMGDTGGFNEEQRKRLREWQEDVDRECERK